MHHGLDITRYKDVIGDIVPDKREILIAGQVGQVLRFTGDEIVHTNDLMAFGQQIGRKGLSPGNLQLRLLKFAYHFLYTT